MRFSLLHSILFFPWAPWRWKSPLLRSSYHSSCDCRDNYRQPVVQRTTLELFHSTLTPHQLDLPKEAVGLVLESVVVTSSTPETILLTEEIYEGVVSVFREARDLCIEGDENITDYVAEGDSDDDSNGVVCANPVTQSTICTSRGRSIHPPTRLDL